MSSEFEGIERLEARLAAHEHLIRHLVVTVLARSEDPEEALEGFQKRLTAPLRHPPSPSLAGSDGPSPGRNEPHIIEIIDWIAKGIREDIQHALAQLAGRRK